MIVLDASAVVDLLLQRGTHVDVTGLLEAHDAISAELLVPEVLQTLRRFEHRGELTESRAADAVDDLIDLPVELYPISPMARAVWDLRAGITAYDASYVALAERTGGVLVTADRRLAETAERHCQVARLTP